MDYGLGSDYNGEEFRWSKAIVSRVTPLVFSEIYQSYTTDGVVGVARSVPLTFFGVGVSTYKDRPERPETEAEKLAAKTVAWDMKNKPQTAEDKRKLQLKQDLTARSRKGEDIYQELDAAVERGDITDGQKTNIIAAAKKSYLVDKAEGLTLEEVERVYQVATPSERDELIPMLNKKMKNADVDRKLTPEQRQRLESLGAFIPGDVAMPDAVKTALDEFSIKTPDVGEHLTLRKGAGRTRLDDAQYDKYRRETLTRLYSHVLSLADFEAYKQTEDYAKLTPEAKANAAKGAAEYQKAAPEIREKILKKVIAKQRGLEQKETKREMLVTP